MYDLTINIETEHQEKNYIDPGIQENLRFEKPDGTAPLVVESSKNGNVYIAFHLMNTDNKTFIHTEFEPKSDDANILSKKEKNLAKRLLHIGNKLVDASLFKTIKIASFEEFLRAYVAVIGDGYKGKLLRGKIILNNKNFTTFPNYVPFIEKMEIPLAETKLEIIADDKIIRSQADITQLRPNPFMVEQTPEKTPSQEPVDKLPF